MAFLGVGFFSGLVATSPDMLDSLDRYVDGSNLYDINILSIFFKEVILWRKL